MRELFNISAGENLPMHHLIQWHSGYVDDLRKQFGEVETREESPPSVKKAKVRLVHSRWREEGRGRCETALLMIHGDRVYILRATADAAGYEETRAVFDAVAGSIRWLR